MTDASGERRRGSSKPAQGTQAIRRAISILKAFDVTHPSWDPSELSDALRLKRATVVRMLVALEDEGLVVRSDSGRFTLGPELIVLGHLAVRETDLRRAAEPYLDELSARCGEAVTLEVPSRPLESGAPNMLVIEEVAGRHLLGVRPFVGRRLPVHATSTGQAMLAALPEDRLAKLLPETLEVFTDRTVFDRSRLLERLRKVREQGYAYVGEELERGLIAIAAAIVDRSGAPVAAISLHWPVIRFNASEEATYGGWLRDAALAVSKRLGHAEPK